MEDESKPPHWLGIFKSSSVPLLATKLKSFILKYVPKVPKSNNELIT